MPGGGLRLFTRAGTFRRRLQGSEQIARHRVDQTVDMERHDDFSLLDGLLRGRLKQVNDFHKE
jgi:hypothetical protein